MRLLSLELIGQYKGLKDQYFNFRNTEGNILALIGLNGSGKSQLLELIAEAFAYLERWQREDFVVRTPLPFEVSIEYAIKHQNQTEDVILVNINKDEVKSYKLTNEGERHLLLLEAPLPDFIVGYASGLNENLQRAFMKNSLQYFENKRISAQRQKRLSKNVNEVQVLRINKKYYKKYPHIFKEIYSEEDKKHMDAEIVKQNNFLSLREVNPKPSNFIYLDYDSVGLLLLSLIMLPSEKVEKILGDLGFKHPIKAKIYYDLRSGVIDSDSIRDIQMLMSFIESDNFIPMSDMSTDEQFEQFELNYLAGIIEFDFSNSSILNNLREANYHDPRSFFLRLLKLQQLGNEKWPDVNKNKLANDNFIETVKTPLKTQLPLSIVELRFLNSKNQEVCFDDLSDGEAQLMQVLAASTIFGLGQSLFLFDEPETHLNPSWRTYFYTYLENALNINEEDTEDSQIFLSTHSPFMISSLKKENVFFFERNHNGLIDLNPVEEETYGASFDVIIKRYFGLRSLISHSVIDEIREQLKLGDAQAKQWIEDNLGLSAERAYLIKKLSD
ncbi:AAA family ATPase [Acinetobacter baumannii]|uniref:AAA family ATPase n=1 Tax=Acinetobacter baumannii TaxID=470 RepID=UPI00233F836C|nr:AAA family ATPase [Acinetobacter baumannii]MDC5529331.1 AAA family ATPase [Acinetobacter baumannii]MDD7975769.1 AAA family ATPase [Acinetobacter baumannii]MDO8918084.1 AAA family ATPase [Acinetobacter baumannii]